MRRRRLQGGAWTLLLLALAAPAAAAVVHHEVLSFEDGPLPPGASEGTARGPRGLTLGEEPFGPLLEGSFTSAPIPAPFAFTAVGPHWLEEAPAGTEVGVELSVSADGVAWTDFHPMPPDPHMTPLPRFPDGSSNPSFGERVAGLFHRSRGDGLWVRFRVRLRRPAGSEAPSLRRLTLTFIDSSSPDGSSDPVADGHRKRPIHRDPQARGPWAEGRRTRPIRRGPEGGPPLEDGRRSLPLGQAEGGYPKPPVHSRAAWGARPPACGYTYCSVTHVAIHHTAGVGEYECAGFDECATDVRAIQAYHMDVNGWCDVGYNYLASSDGALWEGRGGGDDVRGAHDGFNCGSMGVANMGYYHPPYDHAWTEEQMSGVAELTAWKCDQKGIDPFGVDWYEGFGGFMETIYGHRDVAATACPGDTLYPFLGDLQGLVAEKLAGGEVTVLDNPAARLRGEWTTGTLADDKYGDDYYWTSTGSGEGRRCAWSVPLEEAGEYDVSLWWSEGANRNPQTQVAIRQGGTQVVVVDQQSGGGQWNHLGSFSLAAGKVQVAVLDRGEPGWVVVCDALRLARIPTP